ncbi:radical SAM protein [Candidatus Woesearchaeota archaeon]|nr:radical SAM protein [Candidatus Woesearchaeota archaeon]
MAEPKTGVIIISPGCKNRCVFCLNTYTRPLTAEGIRNQEIIIAKKLIKYKKQGCENINISGNDALEYDKLVPMIKYIKKIGFKQILLCTHGRISQNSGLIIELIDAGVTSFRIPVYGSNAEIHDSVTQAIGSFDEAIRGIKLINEAGKSQLRLLTVVVQQNKEDLIGILKLAMSFNPVNFGIDVAHLYPDVKSYSFCVPYAELGKYLRELIEFKIKNNIPNISFNDIPYCVFGRDYEFINMPKNAFKHEKPKVKVPMCRSCSLSYKCEGFFLNDIKRFGIGNLKPLK